MRKGNTAVLTAVLILNFALSADCLAQRGRGGGGWGAGSAYNRQYDVTTVEAIRGEISSVDRFMPRQGVSEGIHLVLATGSESISVHLGPAWFIENQDEMVVVGDAVVITGSRIVYQGDPAIIAASVEKGEQVLQLRDELGYPVWSGWRRR